jgi:hypothetical protein
VKADAAANVVTWDIRSPKRVGVEKFWFGGKTVSLLSREPDARGTRGVSVLSDGDFRLKIRFNGKTKTINVPANESVEVDI